MNRRLAETSFNRLTSSPFTTGDSLKQAPDWPSRRWHTGQSALVDLRPSYALAIQRLLQTRNWSNKKYLWYNTMTFIFI